MMTSIPHQAVISALGAFSIHILSTIAAHQQAMQEECSEDEYHFVFGNLIAIYQSLPVYEMLYQVSQRHLKLTELDQMAVNGYLNSLQQFKEYIEPYLQMQQAQQKH
ncbi:hypothetical protein [Wielerella bovis]|uniref:hypothetical protein n=1 Tax=Wielerella bovis TaxID=2917790 RepID=UPI00201925E8|nr:hypothetical protein [Wielerella bovis]ULJ67886.1 hypothetical protein MIS31_04920 [Wielerella bovis]